MSITLGDSFGRDNNNIADNNKYIAKICDNNETINNDIYKKLQQEQEQEQRQEQEQEQRQGQGQEQRQEKPRCSKLFLKLVKINVSTTALETKTEQSSERERDKSTEYYYQHREQKLEYQKKYNRQKGDAIKGYNKSYYMKRREEILEKARTKVTCECGCVVQLFNMNSHKKTKKHVRYLEMRQAMTAATAAVVETE
jgi:hypothetical protein